MKGYQQAIILICTLILIFVSVSQYTGDYVFEPRTSSGLIYAILLMFSFLGIMITVLTDEGNNDMEFETKERRCIVYGLKMLLKDARNEKQGRFPVQYNDEYWRVNVIRKKIGGKKR